MKVIAVRFKAGGKSYFFDPGEIDLKKDPGFEARVLSRASVDCGSSSPAAQALRSMSLPSRHRFRHG